MPPLRRLDEGNQSMFSAEVVIPVVAFTVLIVLWVALCRCYATSDAPGVSSLQSSHFQAVQTPLQASETQREEKDIAIDQRQQPMSPPPNLFRSSYSARDDEGSSAPHQLKSEQATTDWQANVTSYMITQSTISDQADQCNLLRDAALAEMRIPLEVIQLGPLISRGGFGEVFVGNYQGTRVAVKRILPHLTKEYNVIRGFLAEAKICVGLCHPHIVSLIGIAWNDVKDLCVVTEFMSGGDLRELLDKYRSARVAMGFANLEKLQIASHVASALHYLHVSNVIHRDLKSRNVLLNDKNAAKLTDFGISRTCTDETMTAGVGTSRWIAPEVMKSSKYDEKADMYSFGAVLAELDNYLIPYGHADRDADGKKLPEFLMIQRILNGEVTIEFSTQRPSHAEVVAVHDLAMACVSGNPRLRPTAKEAMVVLERAIRAVRAREAAFG